MFLIPLFCLISLVCFSADCPVGGLAFAVVALGGFAAECHEAWIMARR